MMILVKKWEITVQFQDKSLSDFTMYIHSDHYSNILKTLSEIEFKYQPNRFWISLVEFPKQEKGV